MEMLRILAVKIPRLLSIILLMVVGVLFSVLPVDVSAAGPWSVSSPDGSIVVTIQDNSGTISYSVTKNSTVIFENSTLGINTSIADFTNGLVFSSSTTNTINETYSLPGRKKATYTNNANQLTLKFTKSSQELQLIFRAYNDGAAYRYYIPGSGSINITSENSNFNLPDASTGWAQSYTSSYEASYPFRSNFTSGSYGMPVLVKYSDTTWAVLAASDVAANYHVCRLNGGSGANLKVTWPSTTSVTGTRPFNSPWRLAMIGSLATIFESTMVENLSSPPMLSDTSWIKPGRSAWSWWSGDSQSDYNTQVAYVDFAATMGWEYYLCDAGWQSSWMPTLINYANSKGVGILIWDDWVNVDTESEMRTRFGQWAGWGAKGVKIDYFYNDNQSVMAVYDKIAQIAAEYKLLVNYHGATIPNGLSRRWPNVLTQEGIYGAEQYKPGPGPSAAHNVTICFTRNAVGPMDYTPVTYSNNRGLTTWAHQTALPVIFSSYITHMADRWSTYNTSVAKEFLRYVPAIWDETKLLEGYPDQYITVARRNGSDWYIGSICGSGISRTANIPLTFLGSGSFTAMIYKDGSTDQTITYTTQSVTNTTTLSISLRVNGGCAIRIVPGAVPTPTPTLIPTPSPGSNIALNKTATANQYVTGEEPYKAVDGSVTNNSKWCSTASGDKWLMLDLGQAYTISRWVVKHAGAGGESAVWNTSDFKLQRSTDGTNWTDVDSVTGNTANITDRTVTAFSNRYVRLYITKPAGDTNTAARIYEFELYNNAGAPTPTPTNSPTPTLTPTPAPGGNDEFNLTTLNPMWSWIRQNSVNWSLSANPGYMRIITESGDIYGSSNTTKNILIQNPPAADFSITTKLTFNPTQNYQQAGLIVYSSDDNYVSLCRKFGGSKKFSLIKEVSAAATEQTATDSLSGTVYLKITKSGASYYGYYSSDGSTWTQVGSAITGVSLASPKVGLIAANGSGSVTSINADFDYFHIN